MGDASDLRTRDPRSGDGSGLGTLRPLFRAVTRTVVPESRDLGEDAWHELEAIVEDALGRRPAAMRRQLRLFLRLVQWLPLVRWGRRFTALSDERRRRFLAALQDAPLLVVRRGFWGIRTLAFMGYYGRPEARAEVGYDARPRGRREKETPTSGRGRGELLPETPRTEA